MHLLSEQEEDTDSQSELLTVMTDGVWVLLPPYVNIWLCSRYCCAKEDLTMVFAFYFGVSRRFVPLFTGVGQVSCVEDDVQITRPDCRLSSVALSEELCKFLVPFLLLRECLQVFACIDYVRSNDNVVGVLCCNNTSLTYHSISDDGMATFDAYNSYRVLTLVLTSQPGIPTVTLIGFVFDSKAIPA